MHEEHGLAPAPGNAAHALASSRAFWPIALALVPASFQVEAGQPVSRTYRLLIGNAEIAWNTAVVSVGSKRRPSSFPSASSACLPSSAGPGV
jgi:hypothetical protein